MYYIREKPIPPPKKETRWEKFAKEKGIEKKKKSRMVWDEASQDWKPRWGYNRANAGDEEAPIIEIKPVRPYVNQLVAIIIMWSDKEGWVGRLISYVFG